MHLEDILRVRNHYQHESGNNWRKNNMKLTKSKLKRNYKRRNPEIE